MKILFVGAINQGNPPKGGEEFKNQLLIRKVYYSFNQTSIIDTYQWFKKPLLWWNLLTNILIKNHSIILISASSISTYRLLKLITWIRPSVLVKITYLVVGGFFPEGMRSKRFDWKYYKNLKNVIVQGDALSQIILNNSSLSNVKVVSNFKTFPNLRLRTKDNTKSLFRFVFVGRISESKGIKEILIAAEYLNRADYWFEIDFYGPIEENFDLDTVNSNYCGFLDFQNNAEKAYLKLSEYDCMLFPTYWKGEGFPGVIIDAFVAGLPVIATDWNMNTEIIEEGRNGYIIDPKSSEALVDKMHYVMKNREELAKIRENNLTRAKDYHIDKIWPQILELL